MCSVVQEDVRVSKRVLAFSIVLLLVGCVAGGFATAAETDHSRVTVTEQVDASSGDGNRVAYASLPASAQVVFRDAVSADDNTEVNAVSSDVKALQRVDAVTLDGTTYSVSVESGYRSTGELFIGGVGIVLGAAGVLIFNESLQQVNEELHTVFVGSVAVIAGVVVLIAIGSVATSPLGASESSVSTEPVLVDSVSESAVIRVSSLSVDEQEEVYDVVNGGDSVPVSEASFTVIPELGPGVASDYEYVRSNSEYYKLRSVSNHQWWGEVIVLLVAAVIAMVMVLGGGALAYDTRYIGGQITAFRGSNGEG